MKHTRVKHGGVLRDSIFSWLKPLCDCSRKLIDGFAFSTMYGFLSSIILYIIFFKVIKVFDTEGTRLIGEISIDLFWHVSIRLSTIVEDKDIRSSSFKDTSMTRFKNRLVKTLK